MLCTRTGSMSEAEYVDMLLERQVSGMVFAGGQYAEADAPHDHYTRLLKLRLPVVLVNAAAEHLDFPRVSTDDAVAMEQAYGHLASLGHERIGLIIGPEDHVPSRRKLAAFQASRAPRPRVAGRTRPSCSSARCSRSRAARPPPRRLIRHGATGIVCASDPLALGAIRAARRAGLSVPGDVSVVGYDDSAFMNCTDPPLTTVRQPIEAIGRAAVAMLDGADRGRGDPGRRAVLRARAGRSRLDGGRAGRRRRRRLTAARVSRRPCEARVRLPSPQSIGEYLAMYCRTLAFDSRMCVTTRRGAFESYDGHPGRRHRGRGSTC